MAATDSECGRSSAKKMCELRVPNFTPAILPITCASYIHAKYNILQRVHEPGIGRFCNTGALVGEKVGDETY